jgi:hypothetical protein
MNYKEIAAFTKRRTVKPLPPSGFEGGHHQSQVSQEDTMPHHYKKERNAMNETIHAEFF